MPRGLGILPFLVLAAVPAAVDASLPRVEAQGFTFVPSTLNVTTGQTMEFHNADGVTHTMTATDSSFAATAQPGATVMLQAPEDVGTYSFFCSFHPSMQGRLTVRESSGEVTILGGGSTTGTATGTGTATDTNTATRTQGSQPTTSGAATASGTAAGTTSRTATEGAGGQSTSASGDGTRDTPLVGFGLMISGLVLVALVIRRHV